MKSDDRALIRMLERDTIGLAMSPKARANRYKPTGQARVRTTMATEFCNYKPDGEAAFARKERDDGTTYAVRFVAGMECGEPAATVKKVNGVKQRRCRAHIGLDN